HEMHEGRGRVRQTEGQDTELEVSIASAEGRLRYVTLGDTNLMVTGPEIELREVLRALKPIEQLVDARQRVVVLDGHVVQRTVVDAHTQLAILLLHEQDGCTERRLTRLDATSPEQFL